MLLIYNLVFPILFLLYLPYYLLHIYRRGGLTADYWQRFGFFSANRKAQLRALQQPVWIHAVSVGETVAAITFIKAWLKRHPEEQLVFSCGTSTGFATAAQKLPPQVVRIYCPIDFFWATRHALRLIRPRMLVIFEVEIWPNLVLQAYRRGCRVALVNGRMSDQSSHGYARWKFIFRPIFQAFSCLCVQTPEDAGRLQRVMGPDQRIKICGTMKFDQVPDCESADKHRELDQCFGPGPRVVLVAGSTHPGEEELVCDCYQTLKRDYPELKLVLVPRHQERAAEVEAVLRARQLTWRLLRPVPGQDVMPSPVDVLLVNTTGELMNFYAAGDIAYVGKSLAGQTGGHNMIEPAIFGKAIIYGANVQNFRAVAALFRQDQAAVELASDEAMLPQLRRLLAEPETRSALGRRARQLVDKYRGCIDQTLDYLAEL
ncbi:MAG: 3-deoxy-D-manno-octulosonic acid transferase [Oligosphaeraceae bacterium]|nr:3-deoxy-D-manno-octulosonic acid transferase [Oligosphaeraceae bacterium]